MTALRRVRANPAATIIRERIAQTEALLASGSTPRQAARAIAAEHGLSHRSGSRYTRAVFAQWAVEARGEPAQQRERRRAQIEATLTAVVARGMARTRMQLDAKGCEHVSADPDLRSVVAASELLARLAGVAEPPTVDARSVHFHGRSPEAATAAMYTALHDLYFGPKVDEPAT
jgi:hypothetical protein